MRNPTHHPVTLIILSKISKTSSCASLLTRHSAAIARQRIETLATPLKKISMGSTADDHEETFLPILDVGDDPTDVVGMTLLHIAHFRAEFRFRWMNLGQECASSMIK
jgi:hypothetical protein